MSSIPMQDGIVYLTPAQWADDAWWSEAIRIAKSVSDDAFKLSPTQQFMHPANQSNGDDV